MRLLPLLALLSAPGLALAAPQTQSKPKTAPQKSAKAPAKKLTPAQLKAARVDALWKQSDEKFHAGDYPGAIALHRRIVALEPSDVESYSVASWLLWSSGKSADSLQFIRNGLSKNPKSAEMWDAAGQHYGLQKRRADAELAFGRAVELSGKSADMMLRRRYAHAAREAGNLGKSATIWRALVADFPKDPVNKNNLAKVERQLADKQAGPSSNV